jgi:hypothetical protein
MGLMLVMGCRGNVGEVSRAVVESQDGVSGTGRRGWRTMMDVWIVSVGKGDVCVTDVV